MISIDEYRKDPCRTSSLPYWKLNTVVIPDNMTIIHHRDFIAEKTQELQRCPLLPSDPSSARSAHAQAAQGIRCLQH